MKLLCVVLGQANLRRSRRGQGEGRKEEEGEKRARLGSGFVKSSFAHWLLERIRTPYHVPQGRSVQQR